MCTSETVYESIVLFVNGRVNGGVMNRGMAAE